ncbi:MAG: hypothetical protein J4F40_17450 [Alphaproteobacteria bacterium]|nr:hypothetical protein [Alphaproteobacteria bacterium]
MSRRARSGRLNSVDVADIIGENGVSAVSLKELQDGIAKQEQFDEPTQPGGENPRRP